MLNGLANIMRPRYNISSKITFLCKMYCMKTGRSLLILLASVTLVSSCSLFKPKYGCPAGGVGAEKMLSGEQPKKTKKFKA